MKNWLSRMSYKYRDKGIKNLMYYITGGMLILYLCYFADAPLCDVPSYFEFNRDLIFQGQVWRLVSFIFMPEGDTSLFLFFISLYFYVFISSAVEREWGTIRFNIFYFTGMLGCIIAGMIVGYTSTTYLNMSLFLAFAAMFPNEQLMLFFIIPVKVKYLAWVDLGFFGISFVACLVFGLWGPLFALVFSVINLLIFFGGDYFNRITNSIKSKARKAEWERKTNNFKNPF